MLGSIVKVHIYSEKAKKILRNLHRRFVLCGASQIYSGDFAKFCGLLRIYELYQITFLKTRLFLTPTQKCFDLPNKLVVFHFMIFHLSNVFIKYAIKRILIKPVFVMQYLVIFP